MAPTDRAAATMRATSDTAPVTLDMCDRATIFVFGPISRS